MSRTSWIVTCEHAGNRLPRPWNQKVNIPSSVLNSHEGIDIGAKALAVAIGKKLRCPLFICEETRLLIEPNRSLHHPCLFSRYTKALTQKEKEELIDTYYLPYRTDIENAIRATIKKGCSVNHLSIHSFTPILNGVERNADIGLLYDPKRPLEIDRAKKWRQRLPSELRVRMNYPYRGTSDGLTTHLRRLFPERLYGGIELEVNQRLLKNEPGWITKQLIESLSEWDS